MNWPESLGEPGPAWGAWCRRRGFYPLSMQRDADDMAIELVEKLEDLQGQNNAYAEILEPKIAAVAPDAALIFPMTAESIEALAERISTELTERVEKADAEAAEAVQRAERAEAEVKRVRGVLYCVHCGQPRSWLRRTTTDTDEWELQDCEHCGEEA